MTHNSFAINRGSSPFGNVAASLTAIVAIVAAGLILLTPAASASSRIPIRHVGVAGGTLNFSSTVTRAKACVWSSSPQLAAFSKKVACKNGTVKRSALFAANTTPGMKSFVITLTVHGSSVAIHHWKVEQVAPYSTSTVAYLNSGAGVETNVSCPAQFQSSVTCSQVTWNFTVTSSSLVSPPIVGQSAQELSPADVTFAISLYSDGGQAPVGQLATLSLGTTTPYGTTFTVTAVEEDNDGPWAEGSLGTSTFGPSAGWVDDPGSVTVQATWGPEPGYLASTSSPASLSFVEP